MNSTENVLCWKCGAPVVGEPMPLSRTAACKSCNTDLYVCKMCLYYDTGKAKSCQEPIAEEVRDKERANFCDYFKLKPNAHDAARQSQQEQAKQKLEALFGSSTSEQTHEPQSDREKLENLFKKKD